MEEIRYYYKHKSNPKSTLNLKSPLVDNDDYKEITEEEYLKIINSLAK